jgi:hypothetical protein
MVLAALCALALLVGCFVVEERGDKGRGDRREGRVEKGEVGNDRHEDILR